MKKTLMVVALIALPIGLSGCGEKAEAPEAAAPADAMANMAMPAEVKSGKGTGTVTAIDAENGKITLDHSPVAELEWPAMTMGFDGKPDILKGIAVGDKVAFDVEWNGKAAEIVKIEKQ